jgi:diacylglycerol kinase family enzyme
MVSIICNPVSGKYNIDEKYELLTPISKHLKSEIHGLDTITKKEFKNCLKELTKQDNEICVAGGDGTVLDVLNTIDKNTIISYIPMGSGNALRNPLKLTPISKKNYNKIFNNIISGNINHIDTIKCNGIYTFFLGIGLDALVAFKREEIIKKENKGFYSYAKPLFDVVKHGFPKYSAEISLDDYCFKTKISTLIASKVSHYGYNLQVMPEAQLDDSLLHIRTIPLETIETIKGILSGFLQNQQAGIYYSGHSLTIETNSDIHIHLNGTPFKPTNEFRMYVEPKSFKFRY